MSLTPQYQGSRQKHIAGLLPGHFLGLLPCGCHLDHIPQKGHSAFSDQQGAVLVGCEVEQTADDREALLSTCTRNPPLHFEDYLKQAASWKGPAGSRDNLHLSDLVGRAAVSTWGADGDFPAMVQWAAFPPVFVQ